MAGLGDEEIAEQDARVMSQLMAEVETTTEGRTLNGGEER
jgi:hypothetical protein